MLSMVMRSASSLHHCHTSKPAHWRSHGEATVSVSRVVLAAYFRA